MKDSSDPTSGPIAQNLIKLISNVCFSAFVFAVLIITVIAITYQPPDPWLESAPALAQLFTRTQNATFRDDGSILKTGEDVVPLLIAPAGSPTSLPGVITEAAIKKAEERIENLTKGVKPSCDVSVNCSDPRVLIAVERFNLRVLRSIAIVEYRTLVNGSKPGECDVGWKFRNKKESSWRKYRDFRRYEIGVGENCNYKVLHLGGWHSGVNARPAKMKSNVPRSGKKPKVVTQVRDDEINDTIPVLGSATKFRKGRYLFYSRSRDHCKGMNQYMWSFLCGLGEAIYLNRTFVMDLNVCLAAQYNPSNKDEDGKDFRYYFDFEHLKETASVVEEGEFLADWGKWDQSHKKKVPVRKVATHKVTPMQLVKDKSTIVWRHFNAVEPENYWYRVCEGPAANVISRPWHALWKSKRLMNIVSEISGQMDWDFDAVHVVRGAKAQNKELWPHLDYDTSPDTILAKVQATVKPWRNLYIATNEPFYNYFDKLRSQYKVHLLDDYKELWGNTSEWYNETRMLGDGKMVEFDGYMRVAIDTEVLYRAKMRVETFYDLTKDCKDGINTC